MTYKLFLDDERFPSDYDEEWVIARSFEDAVWYVEARGIPNYISFDHDLGDGKYVDGVPYEPLTGYQFAKWLCDYININSVDIPSQFTYYVHSMNPVGKKNIEEYMSSFFEYWRNRNE